MSPARFIDGGDVPPDYLSRVQALLDDTADAVEAFGDDDLETYAAELRKLEMPK